MKKLAFSLTIWMLLFAPAVAGTLYLEGPNERGQGSLPPATGTDSLDEIGLFFVDVYAEDMPGFAGFQATLQFLDDALVDAAGSTIFIAYNHLVPDGAAPWGDRQITWNQAFFPEVEQVFSAGTFGLLSTQREWMPLPVNDWGDYIDKTITGKTWLMTVGYWYIPGAERDGSRTYTIGADAATTTFGDVDAVFIPYTVVTGSVTIGSPNTRRLVVESTPITGVPITGDKPGTTSYTAIRDREEVVGLTAPASVARGTDTYAFLRWIVDGVDQAAGQATVEISTDADVKATAAYTAQTHTVKVLSMPIDGVAITGDKPGAAPYAATCDAQQLLALTAPATIGGGSGRAYNFLYWTVDNKAQDYGQQELRLTVAASHVAMAIYERRLEGDNNGDCLVDLLDLLYVRSRAGMR